MTYLHPCDGGCWFCYQKIENEEEYYISCEFDTNLHIQCLVEALKDKNNREAKLIYKELHKENLK